MRERLGSWAPQQASELPACYSALRMIQHTRVALLSLSAPAGSPTIAAAPNASALPDRLPDLPLPAYAQQLGALFKIRARQAVMTLAERTAWAAYDQFAEAQAGADAARAARTARNKELKQMRITASAWEMALRSVYNSTFAYTAGLRGATNPDTGLPWTDAERTAVAQKLYPEAALSLVAGLTDDESLRTIGHAAAKQKTSDFSWTPPAAGHVSVRSL
eukprot:7387028-Prymnesium_polylepis.1